ncbi:MAG: hypothetical protein PVG49_11345 [Desulfobacteraceae bacterium]
MSMNTSTGTSTPMYTRMSIRTGTKLIPMSTRIPIHTITCTSTSTLIHTNTIPMCMSTRMRGITAPMTTRIRTTI